MNKLAFAILIFSPISILQAADTPASKPNILFILADDLGYGDLACYGHETHKTPRLDRMATEGSRLTHFNTPFSFCAPTRASLLTGRFPHRCGMTGNPAPDGDRESNQRHLPVSEILLPQLLKANGYASGMVGKWHLGHVQPELHVLISGVYGCIGAETAKWLRRKTAANVVVCNDGSLCGRQF